MIDYLRLTMTPEELEQQEVIGILRRAKMYIQIRRPYEYDTIEVLIDLLDAIEGARRAKLIN